MKILRDFVCLDCDKVTEEYVDNTLEESVCSCGGKSLKMLSAPRIGLDGTNPDFPTAYDHWANIREAKARQKRRKDL